MPLIIRNRHDRATVQLAHATTLRSSDEIINQLQAQNKQLQAQLKAEREQHAFNLAQVEQEKLILSRELIEARINIAWRDQRENIRKSAKPFRDDALNER